MEEELISDAEWELANKLRKCCTPMGDEKESSLRQSSAILFEMGKIYLDKAINTTGMLQKLNFIKCATLLHGSRVRFEKILNDQDMENKVREVLNIMGDALVMACGGDTYDIGFLEASWKLEFFLNQLRETEKNDLSQLDIIMDNLSDAELWERRKDRVKFIEEILQKNTSHYKAIMVGITIECTMILGEPPCKYAIVGLGSLARQEVTLYSDFEHVIVIDDVVTKLSIAEQDKIQEYFRWFTVIFQIIVIGIGETFIRSVGVKSLNDLYSEDEKKNWFYDMFTPSGISFDGRVPHSCNIPLGRQEATKYRRHIVELIQPASKMAKLLTSDEHIKNGYYLSDLLSRTCFVIGNPDLYEDFRNKTFAIMSSESSGKSVEEWENILVPKSGTIVSNSMVGGIKTYCDIKTMFYRPVTAILAYWARKWRMTAGSSFDCVAHIRNHPNTAGLSHRWCDRVEYTLAVVSEMRLKAYAYGRNQRLKVLHENVEEFVGNCAVMFCCDVIRELYATVKRTEPKRKTSDDDPTLNLSSTIVEEINNMRIRAQNLNIMGHHDGARKILENLVERGDLGHLTFDIRLALALTYVFLGDQFEEENENRITYFTKAEKMMCELMSREEFHHNAYGRATICAKLASIYFNQKREQEMASVIRTWFLAYLNDDISLVNKQLLLMRALDAIYEFEPLEIREYFVKVLDEDDDLLSQMILRLALACADILEGSTEVAHRNIREIFEKCEENITTFDQDLLDRFLTRVIEIQGKQTWLLDSFLTMELVSGMRASQRSIVDNTGTFKTFTTPQQRLLLFLLVSETEKEKRLKIRYALKAVGICKEIEKSKIQGDENLANEFKKQYCRAISLLFAVCDNKDIPILCTCYRETPPGIRNSARVQLSSTTFVVKFLRDCVFQVSCEKSFSNHEEVLKICDMFPMAFLHPASILEVNDLLTHIHKLPGMTKFFSKWKTWLEPCTENRREIKLFNRAVHMISKYDVVNSSKLFWKLLHVGRIDTYLKRKASILLQHLVIIHPNITCMAYLAHRWNVAVAEHASNSESQESKLYNSALNIPDINRQAKIFWKIMNSEDEGSFIHRKSSLFLLCIVDKRLSQDVNENIK